MRAILQEALPGMGIDMDEDANPDAKGERAGDARDPSILDWMRPEVLSSGEGRAELRFPVRSEQTIPGGSLQGGVVAVMLDMTMAFAAGRDFATATLHYDILRPPRGPKLTVSGRIVQAGHRLIFAEAEMRDEEGRIVARGRQTAVPV